MADAAGYCLTFGQVAARKISVGRGLTKDCSQTCLAMARLALGAIVVEQILMTLNELRIVHGVH